MYYECRFFKPHELVDRNTFTMFGGQVWMLFRPEALISLDGIRSWFDKFIIVNNWSFGGSFQFRGFRPYDSEVGARYSQHRLGNAFDLDVQGLSAEEVRKTILDNKNHEKFRYINCLEMGVGWVHFDCRNIKDLDRIKLVKP